MKDVLEFTSLITPDLLEYKFDTSVRFLLTEEGLGLPPIEYITQQGPFQHGTTLVDYRLQPRVIQLLLRQNGVGRTDYWRNRSLLIDAVRPNRAPSGTSKPSVLRKIFPDNSIRDLDVVIVQGPIFAARDLSRWDEWGYTETLRFIAYDPTFYDPVLKNAYWELMIVDPDNIELVFPITFPIEFGSSTSNTTALIAYEGTWLSYPKITAYGPIDNLIITNEATGEFIHLEYDIIEGDQVVIDLPYGNKTVTNLAGDNLIGSISLDSDLVTFHIAPNPEAPNGDNLIRVRANSISSSSQISIDFYERYIGL